MDDRHAQHGEHRREAKREQAGPDRRGTEGGAEVFTIAGTHGFASQRLDRIGEPVEGIAAKQKEIQQHRVGG